MLKKDISFSLKVQMVMPKINSLLNLPINSFICMLGIEDENKTNNQ